MYQSLAEGTLLCTSSYLSHTLIDSCINHQLPKSCAETDYVSKYGGRESAVFLSGCDHTLDHSYMSLIIMVRTDFHRVSGSLSTMSSPYRRVVATHYLWVL